MLPFTSLNGLSSRWGPQGWAVALGALTGSRLGARRDAGVVLEMLGTHGGEPAAGGYEHMGGTDDKGGTEQTSPGVRGAGGGSQAARDQPGMGRARSRRASTPHLGWLGAAQGLGLGRAETGHKHLENWAQGGKLPKMEENRAGALLRHLDPWGGTQGCRGAAEVLVSPPG